MVKVSSLLLDVFISPENTILVLQSIYVTKLRFFNRNGYKAKNFEKKLFQVLSKNPCGCMFISTKKIVNVLVSFVSKIYWLLIILRKKFLVKFFLLPMNPGPSQLSFQDPPVPQSWILIINILGNSAVPSCNPLPSILTFLGLHNLKFS